MTTFAAGLIVGAILAWSHQFIRLLEPDNQEGEQ